MRISNMIKRDRLFVGMFAGIVLVALLLLQWSQQTSERADNQVNGSLSLNELAPADTQEVVTTKTVISDVIDSSEVLEPVEQTSDKLVLGVKDYDDEWCFWRELNDDGRMEGDRLLYEYNLTHGYPQDLSGTFMFDGYNNFPLENLKQLGESGDLLALYYLVDHPDVSEEDREWAIYESYVLGGTALISRGISAFPIYAMFPVMPGLDPEAVVAEAREELIKAVALGRFAGLRGDLHGALLGYKESQLNDVLPDVKALLMLTPEEIAHTAVLAEEFLDEINTERRYRGMGELRNNTPKYFRLSVQEGYASRVAKGEDFGWATDMLSPDKACFDKMVANASARKQ
jgi:hypothetical protein